jgi:hypothetical protein
MTALISFRQDTIIEFTASQKEGKSLHPFIKSITCNTARTLALRPSTFTILAGLLKKSIPKILILR